jgi:hypothetical protein
MSIIRLISVCAGDCARFLATVALCIVQCHWDLMLIESVALSNIVARKMTDGSAFQSRSTASCVHFLINVSMLTLPSGVEKSLQFLVAFSCDTLAIRFWRAKLASMFACATLKMYDLSIAAYVRIMIRL